MLTTIRKSELRWLYIRGESAKYSFTEILDELRSPEEAVYLWRIAERISGRLERELARKRDLEVTVCRALDSGENAPILTTRGSDRAFVESYLQALLSRYGGTDAEDPGCPSDSVDTLGKLD